MTPSKPSVLFVCVHNAGRSQMAAAYLPLLPYMYTALDRVDAYLDGKAALPADAVIHTVPRMGKPLTAEHLAMPQ